MIDLSRVSRIDSWGLGVLIHCYSHAICNSGALKLLNPSAQVKVHPVHNRPGRRIGQL